MTGPLANVFGDAFYYDVARSLTAGRGFEIGAAAGRMR